MVSEYRIYWTSEAVRNLEAILDYLGSEWTQREVDNFKIKLKKQLRFIEINPKLFPVSFANPRLRRAVLSRQTTIFYEFTNQRIYLIYLFNNYKSRDILKD